MTKNTAQADEDTVALYVQVTDINPTRKLNINVMKLLQEYAKNLSNDALLKDLKINVDTNQHGAAEFFMKSLTTSENLGALMFVGDKRNSDFGISLLYIAYAVDTANGNNLGDTSRSMFNLLLQRGARLSNPEDADQYGAAFREAYDRFMPSSPNSHRNTPPTRPGHES